MSSARMHHSSLLRRIQERLYHPTKSHRQRVPCVAIVGLTHLFPTLSITPLLISQCREPALLRVDPCIFLQRIAEGGGGDLGVFVEAGE